MNEVTTINIKELNERIRLESSFVDIINMEMGKVIVGQKHLVESLLIGLLADGHILLEGVPGLAKHWPLILCQYHRCQTLPEFSLPRFAPCRPDRYNGLQPEEGGIPCEEGAHIHQLCACR